MMSGTMVCSGKEIGLVPRPSYRIGDFEARPDRMPQGYRFNEELGIVHLDGLLARRLHAQPAPDNFTECPRIARVPDGSDLIVVYVAGHGHTWGSTTKKNDMYLCRSSDNGETWSEPSKTWNSEYNQNSANFLIPPGSKRIYSFAMEAPFEEIDLPHNGPLGMRYSDDGGRSWSEPERIRPSNDPGYKGVCHMQCCIADDGAWILPTYTIEAVPDEMGKVAYRNDIQYILRSIDEGSSWELIPGPRPGGWRPEGYTRLLEGTVINIGKGRIVMYGRVPSGKLWEMRSEDHGKSWGGLKETPLVHPDAPPMVYSLDGHEKLIAFIHNRGASDLHRNVLYDDRRELWISLSEDGGLSWSEPRFFIADGCDNSSGGWHGERGWVEVCYSDLEVEGDTLHYVFNHQKRQIHYVRFSLKDIERMPTRAELGR